MYIENIVKWMGYMLDFFINIMISNIFYMLIFFGVTLILCHFFLVRYKKLAKKTWKKIEYIWLLTTLIGIISITSELRINTAQNWFKIEQSKLEFLYNQIKYYVNPSQHTYYCMEFRKTSNSPLDFDEIVRNSELECQWIKKAYEHVSNIDIQKFPIIVYKEFPQINFTSSHSDNYIRLEQEINEYNEQRETVIKMEKLSYKSDFENILFIFAPFLLILALSLRITKVTAELKQDT